MVKYRKKNLEKVLSHLTTTEGRAWAVYSLSGAGKIPQRFIDEAIKFYENTGNPYHAFSIALDAGMLKKAQEVALVEIEKCEDKGKFSTAASLARDARLVERAVEDYEKAQMLKEAADLARSAGMKERAIGLYEKLGDLSDAARLAEDNMMLEKAVELYEKIGRYSKAGELAEKAGKKEKAAQMFLIEMESAERSGNLNYAVIFAEKLGKEDKAKQLCTVLAEKEEKIGNIESAARYAKKAGMEEKAKQLYSIIIKKNMKKDPRLSARYAMEAGLGEEAIRIYSKLIKKAEKNKGFDYAISLAKEAEMKEKVKQLCLATVEHYEKELTTETDYYKRLKLFERVGEAAEEIGLIDKAMESYEKGGSFFRAAQLAKSLGQKKSAKSYEKLSWLIREQWAD
ncbi:hypothetical protein FJZ53_05650 [Candidatus Woesearchaeota archaeon]|nr:hypothetical protein [Candidatus Woesearchaeota archaeon]